MKIVFEIENVKKFDSDGRREGKKKKKRYKDNLFEKVVKGSKKMMKIKFFKIRKITAVFLMTALLLLQNPYMIALAQEAPSAPSAPTAPTPPPEPVSTTTPPPEPTAPVAPTPPPQPTVQELLSPTPTPEQTSSSAGSQSQSSDSDSNGYTNPNPTPTLTASPSNTSASVQGTGNQNGDGSTGSVSIATGDANNTGNISVAGNENLSVTPTGSSGGATVVNSGNGSDSVNSGSVSTSSDTSSLQTNNANVGNTLNEATVTGDNSASKNTGGDTTITTGDANTSGTIMTAVNTNLNGVAVYEFNVADDHLGDYVLDFSEANCVSGCGTGSTSVANTGNGADSTNTATSTSTSTDTTTQTNNANIENNMNLLSDSGSNDAYKNTGGDTSIVTGDANIQGSIINFVNNNIDGNVVYGIVNIYGNLYGDIVLPDGTVLSCCASSGSVANTGNGADSTNTANLNQTSSDTSYQFNSADIQNNLILAADTGNNEASKNTDGSVDITTGDTNVVAQLLNVANTNINGGTWWLVIVNEAGRWIGKIIGAPDGTNYGGSSGFEFALSESGEITAVNSDNGAGSTNTANASQSSNSTTTQTNNATIVNNVNLEANSGGNDASKNTGGNSSVRTGDANIIANIVNFVNTNIIGGGKLFVTVVNVFGSWLGDFVGPGQQKENHLAEQSLGGSPESSQNNSQSSGSESSSDNSQNQGGSSSTQVSSGVAKTKVLGSFSERSSSGSENSLTLSMGGTDGQSGGDATGGNGSVASKKVIKVNLALLTPLLPLGLWYFIKKRRLALPRVSALKIG